MFDGKKNLDKLYIKWKKAYYQGNPIASDYEFDELEKHLKETGELEKIRQVGFQDEDRNAKFNHPSKMLSLAKYQAAADGTPPISQTNTWLNKRIKSEVFEASPKFDGNALNLVYKKGYLDAALSRGNGTAGRDYTDKLIAIVPKQIETEHEIVEVRGEVVIPVEIFNKKYGNDYKNERNFVAGVLNRDEDVSEITADFVFMAVEAKAQDNSENIYLPTEILKTYGFNSEYHLFLHHFRKDEFENAYNILLEHRKNSPFRLDGFVIKTSIDVRKELGENSHDPNWAIAIKFPPEEAITKIVRIQWNFGKTGRLTPVAILEPTLLDGTTVQRASVHNYGWMITKGCVPGATVTIAKKGDIIPQVINIL